MPLCRAVEEPSPTGHLALAPLPTTFLPPLAIATRPAATQTRRELAARACRAPPEHSTSSTRSSPPRHPPCSTAPRHRSHPHANPTARPLAHWTTQHRVHHGPSSAYKCSPPRAAIPPHRTTPAPPVHSTTSSAPPGGRNRCRRAAAALRRPRSSAAARGGRRSISGRAATPSLSLFFPNLCLTSPPPHTHALVVICTGAPPGARLRRSVSVETEPSPPTHQVARGSTTAPTAVPEPPPPIPAVTAVTRALGEPLTTAPSPAARWRRQNVVVADALKLDRWIEIQRPRTDSFIF